MVEMSFVVFAILVLFVVALVVLAFIAGVMIALATEKDGETDKHQINGCSNLLE